MTRYPSAGKGGNWTTKELHAIPVEWKQDILSENGGLTGQVKVSSKNVVTVSFSYGYRFGNKPNGKPKLERYYCGLFPKTTIAKIRKIRDEVRLCVSKGIDPKSKKKADKIAAQNAIDALILEDKNKAANIKAEIERNLTFKDLYETWVRDGIRRSDDNQYIKLTFNKHALPSLGAICVRNLSEHDLRTLYRQIIATGKTATAVELSKDIGQMLRWAEQRKPWRALLIDGNPAKLVEINNLVPKGYTKERTRMLSINEIQKLKHIFDDTAQAYTIATHKYSVPRPIKKEVQLAMWICLGTLCRIGELLMTQWKHVDFNSRTWTIPAENVKGMTKNKRYHEIYLSDFVFDKFSQLHSLTGHSLWVFPCKNNSSHVCVKSASKQIGDRQIQFKNRTKKLQARSENNSLVLGDEEWTPHDLRRTGATMMQQLKIHRDVINLCQNHVIGTKIDRVYLLHDYADSKREAWYKLGDKLDGILSSAK